MRLIPILLIALLPCAVFAGDAMPEAIKTEDIKITDPKTDLAKTELRQDFHPAASEMEKTLEYILTQSANYFDVDRLDNTTLSLTPALIAAIVEENTESIHKNCRGDENVGTECGLKYNPVICAKLLPDLFYYRTEAADDYTATIFASTSEDGENANKYNLIYADHEWKIDRISCTGLENFNYY